MKKNSIGLGLKNTFIGLGLTDSLYDQCVCSLCLSVQGNHSPDHTISEANTEFTILVTTCRTQHTDGGVLHVYISAIHLYT